jgi:hypothetical protein
MTQRAGAMTDIDRLLRWFADGTSCADGGRAGHGTPRAGAGVARGAPASRSMPPPAVADAIGPADHLVFVLVDGLGMNLIETLPADSFLRTHVVMELQSVHPSGTPAALTSFATGCWPAEHGVIGWFTYLADAGVTATILPFIERLAAAAREFGI